MNPSQVLEKCIAGEVPEANALPQLLHIYRKSPRAVVTALCEKATSVLQQSDAGQAAVRAGAFLVNVANFLDQHREDGEKSRNSKKGRPSSAMPEAAKPLLEHILHQTGGQNRGPKDKATRAQGCTMLASLSLQAPEHPGVQDKLLEFSLDKVPSIREKAVRGLAGLMPSPVAESALLARISDPCTAVRASAVRGLRVSASTVASVIGRIDDVEACVRSQLFLRLAEQPSAVDVLGPAALTRLIAGLSDRMSSVRSAAGQAVDAWCQHLGGVLSLLDRCDLMGDEALGEAAAAALGSRFPEEGLRVVQCWLGGKAKDAKTLPAGPGPVLFARMALAAMEESAREEVLDVAVLIKRTQAALEACESGKSAWQDYLLRQLLHVVALADIGDEALRRDVEKLAEAVLFRGPLSKTPVKELGTTDGTCRMAQSAIDLGIVILRKASGLVRFQVQTAKTQALEARCSTRVVLLVSEICQPFESASEEEGEGQSFTTRLSLKIQELNSEIEKHQKTKDQLDAAKKKACAAEEYIQAQKLKDQSRKNEKELSRLEGEQSRLLQQRDGVCLRVLAIVSALLRWANSDLRKDPALMGTLHQILLPMVSLPALSKEVEVCVVYAICLFSVRDGEVAKSHWSLMLTLLRALQEVEGADASAAPGTPAFANLQCDRARAAVAARALADCARVHGGLLDRDEVLSAASALAAAPFSSRQVVIEPLCGWLLSLGHIFFEEHLKEPVLEVQWALGWMLVEAFKQRQDPEPIESPVKEEPPKKRGLSWVTRPGKQKPVVEASPNPRGQEDAEAIAMASRLTQFFALLPKHPGKHGAPMLSLALESVAESGLWRRGVLLPHNEDGQTRWLRNFSWPELFSFVHERLPTEMRFRLWRCSLQICVSSPALAPLAEIPFALASVAADAPPGASELLQEALDLGADPESLGPLCARLPPQKEAKLKEREPKLLLSPADGINAERERRAELASLGINIEVWAPSDLEVPKSVPLHHRMRCARKPKGPVGKGPENCDGNVAPEDKEQKPEPETKRRRKEAPRLPLQEIRQASRKSAEV